MWGSLGLASISYAVAREPVGKKISDGGWWDLMVALGLIKRGCYFLPLSLGLYLSCHSRDTGYCVCEQSPYKHMGCLVVFVCRNWHSLLVIVVIIFS